jgi:hypothetical protein
MKNSVIGIGLISFLMMASCGPKEEKTKEVIETKTIEKETVIVRDSVKPDGTTIKVSGKGVSVDSKDVDIEIKD